MRRVRSIVAAAVLLTTLLAATPASATVYLYVTGSTAYRGVGGARLNMADNTAASRIGIPRYVSVYRDSNYAGRAVYIWKFGRKMTNGRYPVVMYAYDNTSDNVFHFTVNSSAYKTPSGVGVGSTDTYVKSKYPSSVVSRGSVYTIFRVRYGTSRPYTDFMVRNTTRRVDHINIYK